MEGTSSIKASDIDFDQFRLRRFVEKLIDLGEVEIHEEPVSLLDVSRIIEASPKASLFRKVGPEQVELVGAVSGSRSRLAAALGVDSIRACRSRPFVERRRAHRCRRGQGSDGRRRFSPDGFCAAGAWAKPPQ